MSWLRGHGVTTESRSAWEHHQRNRLTADFPWLLRDSRASVNSRTASRYKTGSGTAACPRPTGRLQKTRVSEELRTREGQQGKTYLAAWGRSRLGAEKEEEQFYLSVLPEGKHAGAGTFMRGRALFSNRPEGNR